MKLFSAIIVPLDGSATARRGLGCAMWLATRLGAPLHILHVGTPRPRDEALRRLGVPEPYRPLLELHQTQGDVVEQLLALEARVDLGLIVMTARGAADAETAGDPPKIIGRVARAVVERSRAPVLLLPPAYAESLPLHSALVPLSGEPGTDESLSLALRLAQALELGVTVAHVAATDEEPKGTPGGFYSDAPYHEYPGMLNELITRACPLCSAEERGRIADFRLCYGDTAGELLALVEQKRIGLIVVGWHGRFVAGHAHVLKRLIQQANCPVLLAKAVPRVPFRLKVGDALAADDARA